MTKDQSGSAFPLNYGAESKSGMSLRDYFAARALNVVTLGITPHGVANGIESAAELAYKWADAMLAARQK